jgi:hypothetical protein
MLSQLRAAAPLFTASGRAMRPQVAPPDAEVPAVKSLTGACEIEISSCDKRDRLAQHGTPRVGMSARRCGH